MLYVVIEAERARLKKLYKENELITPKSRLIPQVHSWADKYGKCASNVAKEPCLFPRPTLSKIQNVHVLSPYVVCLSLYERTKLALYIEVSLSTDLIRDGKYSGKTKYGRVPKAKLELAT